METRVCVLVSLGRHPRSGRERRAPLDACALELALRMRNCDLEVVHAGQPQAPALREYLGMGPAKITVLPAPAEADIALTLTEHIRLSKPDIVLTGKQAEGGEDSGFLPYFVAQALGYALICDVAEAALAGDVVEVHQSLRHGQRRAVHCPMPVVLTVGRTASPARSPAFVRMRDGEVVLVEREIHVDEDHARWTHQPAKARPKRITASKSADPLERLNAIVSGAPERGRVLVGLSAAEAAKAIHEDLVVHGATPKSSSC